MLLFVRMIKVLPLIIIIFSSPLMKPINEKSYRFQVGSGAVTYGRGFHAPTAPSPASLPMPAGNEDEYDLLSPTAVVDAKQQAGYGRSPLVVSPASTTASTSRSSLSSDTKQMRTPMPTGNNSRNQSYGGESREAEPTKANRTQSRDGEGYGAESITAPSYRRLSSLSNANYLYQWIPMIFALSLFAVFLSMVPGTFGS